jgi:hypothetical protein
MMYSKWKFLLQLRWTKVKAFYLIARHAPFVFITMDLYRAFIPNNEHTSPDNELICCASVVVAENLDVCKRLVPVDLANVTY